MSSNPIKELSEEIGGLKALKVLGIAYTDIIELPNVIAYMDELE